MDTLLPLVWEYENCVPIHSDYFCLVIPAPSCVHCSFRSKCNLQFVSWLAHLTSTIKCYLDTKVSLTIKFYILICSIVDQLQRHFFLPAVFLQQLLYPVNVFGPTERDEFHFGILSDWRTMMLLYCRLKQAIQPLFRTGNQENQWSLTLGIQP